MTAFWYEIKFNLLRQYRYKLSFFTTLVSNLILFAIPHRKQGPLVRHAAGVIAGVEKLDHGVLQPFSLGIGNVAGVYGS